MIVTPATFSSLLAAVDHASPTTFAFRGDEILLREGDFGFPDAAAC